LRAFLRVILCVVGPTIDLFIHACPPTKSPITPQLKKDFARYMEVDFDGEDVDDEDEVGWKLVHGDVFRFPEYPIAVRSNRN
jgi:hypothetical protein